MSLWINGPLGLDCCKADLATLSLFRRESGSKLALDMSTPVGAWHLKEWDIPGDVEEAQELYDSVTQTMIMLRRGLVECSTAQFNMGEGWPPSNKFKTAEDKARAAEVLETHTGAPEDSPESADPEQPTSDNEESGVLPVNAMAVSWPDAYMLRR